MTMLLLLFIYLATALSVSQGSSDQRLRSGVGGEHVQSLSCLSWRLGVETNNVVGWTGIPEECKEYVGNYMLSHQYRKDSKLVANQALLYARNHSLGRDGKDLWVFDIDETSLSNLPYFAKGAKPFNPTLFNKWVMEERAPALPESLELYKELMSIGYKVVFLTGRPQDQGKATANNLRKAGYHTWEKLILKGSSYSGKTATVYKTSERKKLEKSGYRIIGNIGDQWSDIMGSSVGNRTFKLPNPMYCIG